MQNEKLPAVLTHATGLVTTFVGPLVLYFVFRKSASPWLREHLDESLNYWILAFVSFAALITAAVFLPGISIWLALLAVAIVTIAFVFGVISIVKATMGKASHYPLNVKMIK